MKRFFFIFAAVAAFAISCNKEVPETPDQSAPAGMKMVTITASVDDDATKTTYTPDENDATVLKFSWSKGDQISVWCSDSQFHTLTAESDGSSATFSGMIPEDASLGWYAFYPADENHADCKFSIPSYKDISSTNSADIPMVGESNSGVYSFKHCAGAAKITFTNVPDFCETVEISVKTLKLKVSGIFGIYHDSEDPTVWAWSSSYGGSYSSPAGPDSELVFTRKVQVIDNTAILYLPWEWKSSDGLRHESTINVIGYDSSENSYNLLTDRKMAALGDFTRAEVKPLTPLELPDYVPEVNWTTVDWDSAVTSVLADNSSYKDLKELKLAADDYYLYMRVKVNPTVYKFQYNIYGGSWAADTGEYSVHWLWKNDLKYASLYATQQCSVNEGIPTIEYNSFAVETIVENVDDSAYWCMAFPRNAHSVTTGAGEIQVGCYTQDTTWGVTGAIPTSATNLLTVTLP